MISDRRSFVFAVLILLLCLFFIVMSFSYEYTSRLIPLLVGSSTLVLVLAVLIHEIHPVPILKRLIIDWTKDLRGQESLFKKRDKIPLRKLLIMICWILGFFLLIFLLGFHISIALFTFVFLKIEGKAGWIRASVVAGITWAAVFVIFEWAMDFGLFGGVVFGAIISPL
jgi:hypothetical protein